MTARTKNRWITVAALVSAVVGALGAVASTARVLNTHFVPADTFRVFQAGQAIQHTRDSLNAIAQFERLYDRVSVTDSGVAMLVRACHRSGECRP